MTSRAILISLFMSIAGGLLAEAVATAEPWLSTRYAQNCAGCHAPGRKNVPSQYRRCSLNCQGCHVNPSGAGLRSQYGKWNEERWLRSFQSDLLKNPRSSGTIKQQKYANGEWQKAPKLVIKDGYKLVEVDKVDVDEHEYDRRDKLEKQTAESGREFLFQIPQGDPYRLLDESKIDGGGDIRWQTQSSSVSISNGDGTNSSSSTYRSFLMNADVGIRWRPFYRRFHLVYEGRYLGNPDPSSPKRPSDTMSTAVRRSLYAMVDELPYSLYVMAGYYRPAFGYYGSDHTALEQRMFSQATQGNKQAYNINFETLTLGGSPNLPYFNLHLITNQFGGAATDSKTRGIAANLGVRFVTLGASASYSYWRTASNAKISNDDVLSQLELHSIGFGAQLLRTTTNVSLVSYAKDTPRQDFRQGGSYSLDTLTKIWREIYFTLQYTSANRAEDLSPGSGTQIRYGVRSFLTSGIEIVAYMESDKQVKDNDDPTQSSTTTASNTNLQLHAYF